MENNFFCTKQVINVFLEPKKSSKVSSQLIYGEKFQIISRSKNYIKVKNFYDRYIGYIKFNNFRSNFKPTHKVVCLKSRIYLQKKGKTKPSNTFLPFLSEIEILKAKKNLIMFENNKWIKRKEVLPIDRKMNDFSRIFKLFLNCPYRWGGKSYMGIDCSALIQMYYKFNRKFFPRDTIDQIKIKKGYKIKKSYSKGDIIFWNGHVAVCLNNRMLIHAYGPRKKVLIMPIKNTINIIQQTANLKVKKIYKI